MLLMLGHKTNTESDNRINQVYLVVLKGRKIGKNHKPRKIENCANRNRRNRGMPVQRFILKRLSPPFWEPRHSFLSVVTSQALMIAGEKWCNSQVRLNEIND